MTEALLISSMLWVAYTFAGYPAMIWLVAKLRPRPNERAAISPSVAIVIVAYNEAVGIASKIESCLQQTYAAARLRVVVASDGSVDGTAEIARRFEQQAVTLLDFSMRRGKAACLNDAIAACHEEIIVLTDARQRLAPDAVAKLVENFADLSVGAASGELMFESGDSDFGGGVDAYWRYEKFIRRHEAIVHSVAGATGALYAIRRSEFEPIAPHTILDDVLVPMNIVLRGRRVVFDERALAFDRPAQHVVQERARKVRTLAGNFQLIAQYPHLLHPRRNPIFVQYFSHKVMRLIAPYALLLLLFSNALVVSSTNAAGVYAWLLAAQLVCYALAAIGILWPPLQRFRVVRLAAAFVVLNWFAVLGLLHFLRRNDAHLWSAAERASTPRLGS